MSSLFVQSQTYNSSCIPSGDMQAVYRNDAYRLATKRVHDINSPWKDSVIIPEIIVDSIEKALYAIENMHTSSIRDTIMMKFGYHVFSGPFYQADSSHINNAGADWNYSYWLKKIKIQILSGATPTALDSINYLITRYDLVQTPNGSSLELSSAGAINIPALIKQFQMISGIQYAEKIGYIGDGNYIGAEFSNGDIILTYHVGCGDCPLGCTFGRLWRFKVNTSSDCSVQYLSSNYTGLATILSPEELGFADCIGVVVPIVVTNIQVSQKNDYQLVEWQMAMEDNVARYEIERSTDASNYITIGDITVTHHSAGAINYSWNDRDLINGKNFYRIRIIDRSGAIKYSPVAVLDVKLKTTIRVNPTLVTNSNVNIQFGKVAKGIYYIDLLNTAGQKLFSTQVNINTETFNTKLQIPLTLSPGMYIISIHGMQTSQNQLIVVSK